MAQSVMWSWTHHKRSLRRAMEIPAASGPIDEAAVLDGAFEETWTVDMVRERLTEAADVLAVYVMTYGDVPVATVSSRLIADRFPNEGYVNWLGTRPDHTQQGLGAYVMYRLLEDFVARGYTSAVLETDDHRLPAIRTYLKLGFTPVYETEHGDHRERWTDIFQAMFRRGST